VQNQLPTFIADVHLGRTARYLRLLGFDTLYRNDYTFSELLSLGAREKRIVLSKNPGITRSGENRFLQIHTGDTNLQTIQVLAAFNLGQYIHPFSRCMVCNGILEKTEKQLILEQLPPNTSKYYHEFWKCNQCGKLYWKGPHYERMIRKIKELLQALS
jgi:uncharacterized protein